VRAQAAQILGRLGTQTLASLTTALNETLKDPDPSVRTHALTLLTSGVDAKVGAVVPSLVELSRDSNQEIRLQAVQALGRFGAGPVARSRSRSVGSDRRG